MKRLTEMITVIFFLVSFLFVPMVSAAPHHAAKHRIVCHTVEINEELGLAKCETVIQVGHNELNRFTMHRVVKVNENHRPLSPRLLKGPIILLPGGACNFDSYLIGPDGESLATYLALKGMDVYGYSPRGRGLEPGYCDNHDCSAMKDWGFKTYVKDIEFIRKKAARLHHKRPIAAGLSLGAMQSIAAINKKPNGWSGAILWEGTLYYDSPVKELFTDVCANFRALWESGVYYDDQAYPVLKAMVSLDQYDPDGESPFAPGMTNSQFFLFFITMPHNPPDGEAPNYTYAGGDMVNGLYFMDKDLLLPFAMQMNDYEPIAVFRDYMCGLAGERTFTDRLHMFRGPILSMQAGLGFGAYAEYNLELFGTNDITRYIQPEFGHADFGVAKDYVNVVCLPVWNWINEKVIPNWN